MIGNINMYALSTAADQTYKAFSPEAWAKAGEVTLLGMGLIFSVLAILWAVLAIFKLVFAGNTDTKKKSEEAPKKAAEAPAAAPSVEVPAVGVVTPQGDEELIAVITAAVTAYRASEGMDNATASGFRVVSFKRAGAGRAWNSNK